MPIRVAGGSHEIVYRNVPDVNDLREWIQANQDYLRHIRLGHFAWIRGGKLRWFYDAERTKEVIE